MTDADYRRPNYVGIWVWLMGLLSISLLASYLPLSQAATVTIIFLVAAAKAVLVAAYYMHVRFERWLVYAIAITPVVLFVALTLTLVPDVVLNPTRVPLPPGP